MSGTTLRAIMRTACFILIISLCFVAACVRTVQQGSEASVHAVSQSRLDPSIWPGRKPDGSVLLHNQWSLRPIGHQVELADFPINIAVHPGGRFAAILHTGYGDHEILVVNLAAARIVSRFK